MYLKEINSTNTSSILHLFKNNMLSLGLCSMVYLCCTLNERTKSPTIQGILSKFLLYFFFATSGKALRSCTTTQVFVSSSPCSHISAIFAKMTANSKFGTGIERSPFFFSAMSFVSPNKIQSVVTPYNSESLIKASAEGLILSCSKECKFPKEIPVFSLTSLGFRFLATLIDFSL